MSFFLEDPKGNSRDKSWQVKLYEISKNKDIQASWSSDIGDIGNGSLGQGPHEEKRPDEPINLFGHGSNCHIQIITAV